MICLNLSAQEKYNSINWWETDKSFGDFIFENNDAYFFSFKSNGGANLEMRSKDFTKVIRYESKKDANYSNVTYRPSSFISFNNQIYGLSEVKEKDKVSMYAHQINLSPMSAVKNGMSLGSFATHSNWKAWKNVSFSPDLLEFEDGLVLRISNDKKKLVIKNDEPASRDSKLNVKLTVFDSELQNEWQKEVVFDEFEWKNVICSNTQVTNSGNVFFIVTRFLDGTKERKGDIINYKYYLVGVFNDGNDKTIKELSFDNKFIRNVILSQEHSGEIVCGGYYSNEGKYDLNGSYFLKVSSTNGEEIVRGINDFDLKIFETVNSKDYKEPVGNMWIYPEHFLKAIYIRSNGGVYLISEKRFTREPRYNYCMDFMVTSYNNTGSLEWHKDFFRNQVSSRIYASISFVISTIGVSFLEDKIIIYTNSNQNDFLAPEVKNKKDIYMEQREEGYLVKFIIDKTGFTNLKKIQKFSKNEDRFQVESIKSLSNGVIIGSKNHPTNLQFGVLKDLE